MRAARLAGQPHQVDVQTSHRMVSFYMGWFTRMYRPTDNGWVLQHTPDGKPICEQDAYFWLATELIAREMNTIFAEQMAELKDK